MFSGRRLQFSGTPLTSFASCVRSNRHRSQVGRSMFSRPYRYKEDHVAMPAIPEVPFPLTRNPPVEPTTKGHQESGRQGAHALQEFRRRLTTHECRRMVAYAGAPRRRWWRGTADHVFRHRRSRDLDAKHRQFAVDARRWQAVLAASAHTATANGVERLVVANVVRCPLA
jgi:hypothetical protein